MPVGAMVLACAWEAVLGNGAFFVGYGPATPSEIALFWPFRRSGKTRAADHNLFADFQYCRDRRLTCDLYVNLLNSRSNQPISLSFT